MTSARTMEISFWANTGCYGKTLVTLSLVSPLSRSTPCFLPSKSQKILTLQRTSSQGYLTQQGSRDYSQCPREENPCEPDDVTSHSALCASGKSTWRKGTQEALLAWLASSVTMFCGVKFWALEWPWYQPGFSRLQQHKGLLVGGNIVFHFCGTFLLQTGFSSLPSHTVAYKVVFCNPFENNSQLMGVVTSKNTRHNNVTKLTDLKFQWN